VTEVASYRRLPAVTTPRKRTRKLEQPDVVWALLNALRRGEPLSAALRAAAVGQSTYYRERRQSPLLRGLIDEAEAAGRERRAAVTSPSPVAPPVRPPAPSRPRPVEQPNVAGLLDRLAPGPASRTIVVTAPPLVEPRQPLAERAAEHTRKTPSGLVASLTAASRASARERRDSVPRPHAEGRPGGSPWLLPLFALALELVVATVLVGDVILALGIAAIAIAYLVAFRRSHLATERSLAALPPAAEAPVAASHDLRWLDATLAHRHPIPRSKQ
jgi:hypothetical protein